MINLNLSLNELTLDNIGQWPKPVKIGVILVVSLLLVAVGYWLFVKDSFDQYYKLQAESVALKTQFETKQHQASNLNEYYQQMMMMEARFGNMLKRLPTQNEMPGLLEDISKTGIASGLTFELFAPAPEIKHDFYIEVPIKISVMGNYHQFAIFLSRMAQMSRIVTLHDFVIDGLDPDKHKDNPGAILSLIMTAKIYRYRTK